ncbi:3-deoxy-D-manno-octulosonic acid transferase [Polaribacter huanghezhanensis]|uniref:3-deoxy-D-manno-octulosonic acid transferase n=1 Tax=Polaribacter huanghezhanensis TaxID=1354726 RepID=UPI002649DA8A|nr:glycosyltransferase N-terminal domain-containing protein [Polaribacter huanghezhanensis]WKD85628.1 3-deoxy-D-manno-octulosonic acid transferase [Polaribacter huanghezhanensis]
MRFIYNFTVILTTFLLSIVAFFNKKIRLFVDGRKESFDKLSILKNTEKVIWIHAASLGEFEQGRPIIEKVKEQFPSHKIVLTFFSPSGYEIRKEYKHADVVCYLPMDSRKNVRKFLEIVNPSMAIFIKYEFWPNYLFGLKERDIPTILISGIFRKNQIFFKPFGGFMRKSLKAFDHFFVQDESSQELLKSISLNNVTISGDTRFDRVYEILQQDNALDFITEFKNNQYTVVAGSTWKEDEELLVNYINQSEGEKFIIAPHNINAKEIELLKKTINKKVVLYSEYIKNVGSSGVERFCLLEVSTPLEETKLSLKEYHVFIVDTIGILTKIYATADAAYVGGGLTKNGVHNVLEPATFGVPIVIGPTYKKYKEVVDLVALKGCKVIANQNEFSTIFTKLNSDKEFREKLGKINQNFIKNNIGATEKAIKYINQKITN